LPIELRRAFTTEDTEATEEIIYLTGAWLMTCLPQRNEFLFGNRDINRAFQRKAHSFRNGPVRDRKIIRLKIDV
jgi:hypothetical protein